MTLRRMADSKAREIQAFVTKQLGGLAWRVTPAPDGWSKATFLAQRDDERVFVKFDVAIPVLLRLADLGVTPLILKSGTWKTRSFVLQEFIVGSFPNRGWFPTHLPELARLVRTYHQDRMLQTLLPKAQPYRELVNRYTGDLRTRVAQAAGPLGTEKVQEAFVEFERQGAHVGEADLVPTHGDPNAKNFILAGGRTYLVDWDELALADPLRDIGPLLWWYVTPGRWAEFFDEYGIELDNAATDRLYWWTAEESLDVALSLHEKGQDDVEEFLVDFVAAVRHQRNPHGSSV